MPSPHVSFHHPMSLCRFNDGEGEWFTRDCEQKESEAGRYDERGVLKSVSPK
jgi:hypothetical protein